DHTVTAAEDLRIVLQGGVGGRIFERTPDGVEHAWGEVTGWDPPRRLAYLWHLRRDRSDATEVEIRFVARGDSGTRIEIEHRGWERLGTSGEQWREQNAAGWNSLLPHYIAAVGEVGRPAGHLGDGARQGPESPLRS
ncbi:MAG TPA: SRPBCC domain-containing protein, partial [Nakamurella sp.]